MIFLENVKGVKQHTTALSSTPLSDQRMKLEKCEKKIITFL